MKRNINRKLVNEVSCKIIDKPPRRLSKKMNSYFYISFLLFIQLLIHHSNAYCWQSGWNPGFKKEPKVSQLSLTRVRVSWEGIVKRRECADSFLVKYWRQHSPSNYQLTDPVNTDANYIDIDVSPKVGYLYEAIAREDKGAILGIDYNKAKAVKFRTSSYHNPQVSADSSEINNDLKRNGGENNQAANNQNLDDGVVQNAIGLTIEMLVILIVVGLILVLVVVGIMYKLCCQRKSNHRYDDEDDEEESGDGDEDEEEQWDDVENGGLKPNQNINNVNRNPSDRSACLNYKSSVNDG